MLDGLDAQFRGGRLTAVTGPSGSGKTTLLHILAGLRDPSVGSVSVLGELWPAWAGRSAPRCGATRSRSSRRIPALTPFLSARENVEVALALRDLSPEEARQRALDALSRSGWRSGRSSECAPLGGERQRVAIARALAAEARLLLADEPTARLDEANALAVGALFGRYARESTAPRSSARRTTRSSSRRRTTCSRSSSRSCRRSRREGARGDRPGSRARRR